MTLGPLAAGRVLTDGVDGDVRVAIPSFDDSQAFDATYTDVGEPPPADARCLVAFDDDGGVWVIAWEV